MNFRLLMIVLFLLIHSKSFAYWPSVEECYAIDGPANVREDINGELLLSLGSEHQVKVLEIHNSGWFKISYSENPNVCGGRRVGWTYKYNLKPLASDIGDLIKENKIRLVYPKQHYPVPGIYYDREKEGVFLFGELQKMGIASGQEISPSQPMLLYQYCSDGSQLVNELVSINFEYGGDSDSYSPVFRFKKKVSSNCLTINGNIAEIKGYASNPKAKSHCVNLIAEAQDALRNGAYGGIMYSNDKGSDDMPDIPDNLFTCEYIGFPFTLGGSEAYITLFNVNMAPSTHRWDLWYEEKRYQLGRNSYP